MMEHGTEVARYGYLVDAERGEVLREATKAERDRCRRAERQGKGSGIIRAEGRPCYVLE